MGSTALWSCVSCGSRQEVVLGGIKGQEERKAVSRGSRGQGKPVTVVTGPPSGIGHPQTAIHTKPISLS